MERKDFTLFDLMKRFPNEHSCMVHLFNQKWTLGYHCIKCLSIESKQGKTSYNKRCKSCGYEE
ncbi:MAG: hypothetical protein HRT57_13265 [Crocinitomicaceae bacterium]|nr:hypothetical protein [Crocinitomicaceae bacterium]